jgi:hypothetical protein
VANTGSLGGGRRLARKRASSDPTGKYCIQGRTERPAHLAFPFEGKGSPLADQLAKNRYGQSTDQFRRISKFPRSTWTCPGSRTPAIWLCGRAFVRAATTVGKRPSTGTGTGNNWLRTTPRLTQDGGDSDGGAYLSRKKYASGKTLTHQAASGKVCQ